MANVKNFFKSVGNWFKNHVPTRRRIIQVYAALLTNANFKGFAASEIYKNTSEVTAYTKNLCTPGLNCYSCPGAVAACPLGALQNSLGSANKTTPYYIFGILALFGLLLARTICGFLCPFGFIQDMLYKVKSPKVKKSVYTRLLSYLKYVFLVTLVIAVPLIYHSVPGFCKYICPAGTSLGAGGLLANDVNSNFYGMLKYLFTWKFVLLVICIVACIFIYRAFCRFICPLGAIYGFFNKIALLGVKLEKSKCIDCGMCISKCKMDIKHVGDHECINCGECISVCPTKAISWKGGKLFLEPTSVAVTAANTPVKEEAAPALSSILASGTTVQVANENVVTETTTVEPVPATEVKADAPVEVAPVAEVKEVAPVAAPKAKAEKPVKKAEYTRKKSSKILEIVAWSLATILLVSAIIYYNTLPTLADTSGAQIENFTAKIYNTAYENEGEEFNLYDTYYSTAYTSDRMPMMLVFWFANNDESINYIDQLGEIYEEIQKSANLVVIHINDVRASAEDANSKIVEHGWDKYNVPFIQEPEDIDLYNECGGNGSYPMTVFLNINLRFYSNDFGTLTAEEITNQIKEVQESTIIYSVGDFLPDLTVKTYESSYKEGEITMSSTLGKVLVLNFWYVQCTPCVAELPFIEEVNKEFGDDVVVVALHANDEDQVNAQAFINAKGWSNWKTVFAKDVGANIGTNDIFTMLGGKGAYPITIVVNTEGIISFAKMGSITHNELTTAVQNALTSEAQN